MNFFKKLGNLFKNKKFVTWFSVGAACVIIAVSALGTLLPSYLSWKDYYDAAIADRDHKKYLQTLPLECKGITAELNDNVAYYANGKASPKPDDFTVIAHFTEKGEDFDEVLLSDAFTLKPVAGFTQNGGDITLSYMFTPKAPEPEEGEEPVVPEPIEFTTKVECALETVVPVSIARRGDPFRIVYSDEMRFDGEGLTAAVTFNDGTVETVGNDEFAYSSDVLAAGTQSVNVVWSRGGTEFDFDCPVKVVPAGEYSDGYVTAISPAGTIYLEPGDVTADAKPPVRATYESGNRLLLNENEYTVRGNVERASFTEKCLLSVYLKNDPAVFTRTVAKVKNGIRAETAALSLTDTVEINESVWTGDKWETSEDVTATVAPRNGASISFSISVDDISKPNMSMRMAIKPTVTRVPEDEPEAQSDELASVNISDAVILNVNGGTVRLPSTVVTQKADEADKYVFYDVTFPMPVLHEGVNEIKFVFRGEDASKIVIDGIDLETGYNGEFFTSTEAYFAYNAENNIVADYGFSVVKPFGKVAGHQYGHSVCSDGTYLYMVGQTHQNSTPSKLREGAVSKYDPVTNTEVAISANLENGSVNEATAGITYYDNKIIVYYTDGRKMYVDVDKFTDGCTFSEYHGFNFEGIVNEPVTDGEGNVTTAATVIKDIYYNPVVSRFAVYYGDILNIYNKDMTLYKQVKDFKNGAKRVAGSADYIYASYTTNGNYWPRIRVFDWEGNPVGNKEMKIDVPSEFVTGLGVSSDLLGSKTNIQAVAVINGDFYVTLLYFPGGAGDSSAFIRISMPEIDDVLEPELTVSEYLDESTRIGAAPAFTAVSNGKSADAYGTFAGTEGYGMGGASDGNYYYVANTRNSNANLVVTKIDASTLKRVACSSILILPDSVKGGDNSRLFIKDGVLYVVAGDVFSIALDEFFDGCVLKKDEEMTAMLSDNGNRVLKSAYWSETQRKYAVLENGQNNVGGNVYVTDEYGNFVNMLSPSRSGYKVADVSGDDKYLYVLYNKNNTGPSIDVYRYDGEKLFSLEIPGVNIGTADYNIQSIFFHGNELHLSVCSWTNGYQAFHDWTAKPDMGVFRPANMPDVSDYIDGAATPVFHPQPFAGGFGEISGADKEYGKGGVSDGKYLYIAQGTDSNPMKIMKVDVESRTVVAKSKTFPVTGDMGRLFIKDGVLYCVGGDVYAIALSDFVNGCAITKNDAMTALLSQNGAYTAISAYYNAQEDKFVVLASSGDIYVLNGDGTAAVAAFKRSYGSGWTASSVCGDGKYFYVSHRKSGQTTVPVQVFDWSGNHIRDINANGLVMSSNSFNIQAVYTHGDSFHAVVCSWDKAGFKTYIWVLNPAK